MTKKGNKNSNSASESTSRRNKFILGIVLFLFSIIITIAFISYYFNGVYDQSSISEIWNRDKEVNNWASKIGAVLSHIIIYNGFGIASFIFVKSLFYFSSYLILDIPLKKMQKIIFWDIYLVILISFLFGLLWNLIPNLSGVVGYEIVSFIEDYSGKIGSIAVFLLATIVYFIYKIKISPDAVKDFLEKKDEINPISTKEDNLSSENYSITDSSAKTTVIQDNLEEEINQNQSLEVEEDDDSWADIKIKEKSAFEINKDDLKPTIEHSSQIEMHKDIEPTQKKVEIIETEDKGFVIEKPEEEDILEVSVAQKLVQDFGEFDPTLELSNYQFPSLELLKEYSGSGITINQAELEENKNRIVETLRNYKIDIAQIKATVGPTVTLYEIVPEAGIRISKIKSLEDDIALSLAALGIRIIAPIPGKGTIGIEVPNAKPSMVSMKSVIASPKFQQAEMELPIALGKTISNETFVVDLAKMPHLLMAGATGQGKSVGLNAILASLLYKKHPAEVKLVLVDPKKVELTLFNKIERHYLAKLPDTEDAIITDNTKVINTLNSLCIEMDNRYNLLKDAAVRNIKEYNEKFKNRRLNPENGHRFLPYIVLVVDEFADLIMTAGKEVETPIARLAQLARAIGIHLIIATQRPSVNVITGIIKANFPARIAFRVTSKIDSRTILDSQGADQLIGRGDLLYTQGNDLIRVQCAFVDTPEVEKICDFIGSQKAYPDAYLLPEYVGEESNISLDIDISERDSLFRDAAEVIVTAQQGSASLIQRKLKLGYNRAGRLIDQLEAAGIVGPFEGSKARSVLIPDLVSLEHFLNNEGK